MPTLEWVGKAQVVHHDAEVPVRAVEPVWGFDAARPGERAVTGSGNRIIHGDNLEALKALLPGLEGRVDASTSTHRTTRARRGGRTTIT